tara:strand:- start:956 stop:1135 length:180 start_codon:yes stop_codon:yes gene_type:complete
MDNIKILKQLLNGYHLEENELLKAEKIVSILKHEINNRLCKKHNKKTFSTELYNSIYNK